ncbi:MAG: 2,3,4,5-tetrahydropyridine-2,6-dicarboxylate N-succinyltransferase, partial [Hyphomicrobiales bacterium]
MSHQDLQTTIDAAWEDRAALTFDTKGAVREAVDEALNLLDTGAVRVAERVPGETGVKSWKTNQWLKKAVLLSFRLNDMSLIPGGPDGS